MILYNNNYASNSSAVFELVPPLTSDSSNYIISESEPYGPDNPIWMHTGGFHSNVQSGAFRLENGNTLISVADDGQIFEVDSTGFMVWDYTHPGNNIMVARAQKYSIDFLGGGDTTGFPDYRVGDVNFDEKVDLFDLFYTSDMYYGYYLPTPPADINEDSEVNFQDIMAFVYKIMNFNR